MKDQTKLKLVKRLLPHLQQARSLGIRRLRDLHAYFQEVAPQAWRGKPIAISTLRRAIQGLSELGLDPGLDDRSTARKLGKPTRKKTEQQIVTSVQ